MPDRHGRDVPAHRLLRELLRRPDRAHREGERDPAAGDRGGARAAVRLDDVAVERDGPAAERAQVDRGAERAPDEPLDLERPPALLPARRLARHPLVRRAREHPVLGGHPARAGAEDVRRHLLLDRGGAEDVGVAEAREAGALRVLRDAGLEDDVCGGRARRGRSVGASGADSTRAHAAPRRSTGAPRAAAVPRATGSRAASRRGRRGRPPRPRRRSSRGTRGCGASPPPPRAR